MSSRDITDDESGKTVVDANGDDVGIVQTVEHGTAYLEPEPSLTDKIKSKLGWGDTDEDSYPLQEGAIESVTDDEIRLKYER